MLMLIRRCFDVNDKIFIKNKLLWHYRGSAPSRIRMLSRRSQLVIAAGHRLMSVGAVKVTPLRAAVTLTECRRCRNGARHGSFSSRGDACPVFSAPQAMSGHARRAIAVTARVSSSARHRHRLLARYVAISRQLNAARFRDATGSEPPASPRRH